MKDVTTKKMKNLFELYMPLREIDRRTNGEVERKIYFKKLSAGEYIKTKEHQCTDFIFVMKGILKIEKIDENGKVVKLYEIGPGEICHEVLSCYMNCEALNLLGQAITDIEIAYLPMKDVNELLLSDQNFMKFIYTSLYEKFRKVVLDKEEIINEPIKKRLIKYLKSKNGSTIYITHQEIALDLGTAREVVSRNLKSIEKEGGIRLERNRIKILKI